MLLARYHAPKEREYNSYLVLGTIGPPQKTLPTTWAFPCYVARLGFGFRRLVGIWKIRILVRRTEERETSKRVLRGDCKRVP